MSDHSHGGKLEEKFSPWLFIVTVILSLAGLYAVLAFAFPGLWRTQLAAGWLPFVIAFVAVHSGIFEYFFHRYILHAPLVPMLSYFYKQHTLHHALTHIGYHRSKISNAEVPGLIENDSTHIARNTFPIEEEKQHEASYFPWYSLLVFSLAVTPLLALGQWLFPALPMFFAGYLAVAFSMALYELIHAVEHWPQDTWDRLIEHPRYGRIWRKAYAFHLRHHADIRCNEGISGIFGLPLVDFVLGTYVDPETLYTHGEQVHSDEFISPRPRFAFIRWLDRRADEAVKNRRAARRAA